jgi:alkylation response protein AidB-like acyl-CoA dehydrogenase
VSTRFLRRELEALDKHLPGFAARVGEIPLTELEAESNPGIQLFREAGGGGLLVPESYGGAGLPATEAALVQRAIGGLAPSTAVAVTMHQFTMATLVELLRGGGGLEWMVVEAVARQRLLVASGFAEGHPDGKVLSPTLTLVPDGIGYLLSGEKKPCSLAHSMDLITVSVVVPEERGERFAVALVSAREKGISVAPFWRSPTLAGAQTARVVFDRVRLQKAALSYVGDSDTLDRTQLRGYLWFELLIAASYLGIASALVDRVLRSGRVGAADATSMLSELEAAMAGLLHIAGRIDSGEARQELLVDTLLVRYAVERAIQRGTDEAFEAAGAMALAASPDLAILLGSARALSYHPPSRRRMQQRLADFYAGSALAVE